MRSTFETLLSVAALAGSASAWWGTGHLIVSRRAQEILEDSSSPAFDQALTVLGYLTASDPTLTKDEGSHPFTECATFADDIKGEGYSAQSDWHFIDQPYLDEPDTTLDDFDFEAADVDVVDALTDFTAFLKGDTVSSSSPYIKQVQEWFSDENDQKSFALRLVIHYVGDLHQPLHATAEVDSEYPEGDRGGNEEWIPNQPGGVGNLHQIWDSVDFLYTGYPDLPMDDDLWDYYTTQATDLSKDYPVPSSAINTDFSSWAAESLAASQSVVYPGFTEHEDPTDAYKEAAKPIACERLMYAGARLANLIEEIYGSSTQQAETFLQ